MAAPDNSWRKAQESLVVEALQKGLRYVLIGDTETGGLSPEDGAECIEVGCIRFDLKYRQPVDIYASLIRTDKGNPAEPFNGIPGDMLKRAPKASVVWKRVARMIEASDLIVTHRVEFDHAFFPKEIRSLKPWCCSKFDIEWPKGKNGSDLLHLALAMGCGVVHAHRAMSDCEVLMRIFTRAMEQHDIYEILRLALRPKVKVISLAHFVMKDKVKEHGFAWDADAKQWYKWCPTELLDSFPFKTEISRM